MRSKQNLSGLGAMSDGLDPMWGALIASAIGTSGAIGARVVATPGSAAHTWSEGVGLLAGLAAAGAMFAFPGTREAGKFGLAFVGVNQGLRLLEKVLMGGPAVGWVTAEGPNPALGMPTAQTIGFPMAVNQPHAYGTVPGVAGPTTSNQPPVNLLGRGGANNLANLYGATHF